MTSSPRSVFASTSGAAILMLAAPVCVSAQTPGTANRVDPAAIAGQPAYQPLTQRQRLQEFAKDTLNPLSLLTSAASAGFGQLRDRPHEWKQGARGYGLRYGSSYAEHIANETLVFGAAS